MNIIQILNYKKETKNHLLNKLLPFWLDRCKEMSMADL